MRCLVGKLVLTIDVCGASHGVQTFPTIPTMQAFVLCTAAAAGWVTPFALARAAGCMC
jgi:hypothetical protein